MNGWLLGLLCRRWNSGNNGWRINRAKSRLHLLNIRSSGEKEESVPKESQRSKTTPLRHCRTIRSSLRIVETFGCSRRRVHRRFGKSVWCVCGVEGEEMHDGDSSRAHLLEEQEAVALHSASSNRLWQSRSLWLCIGLPIWRVCFCLICYMWIRKEIEEKMRKSSGGNERRA